MNRIVVTGILFLIGLFVTSCTKEESEKDQEIPVVISEWKVPEQEITGSLNPFPVIENPVYFSVDSMNQLDEADLVYVYKSAGDVYIFPRAEMHVEIVNDIIDEVPIAITYCPITRSGICWNRLLDGDTILLTASGYLYKDNLLPLDIHSGSIWSQMLQVGVKGNYRNRKMTALPLLEISWKTARETWPDANVFQHIVANKSYGVESEEESNGGLLSGFQSDNVSDYKNRVLGVLGAREVSLFRSDVLQGELQLINMNTSAGEVLLAGSATHQFLAVYKTPYKMIRVEDSFPVIMEDETGSLWNIFGEAVSGARTGEKLQFPPSYLASEWAWISLFENLDFYSE